MHYKKWGQKKLGGGSGVLAAVCTYVHQERRKLPPPKKRKAPLHIIFIGGSHLRGMDHSLIVLHTLLLSGMIGEPICVFYIGTYVYHIQSR